MRIAVTGAGGFLGQHLLPRLVAQVYDAQVLAFSSQDPATLYRHDRVHYRRRESAASASEMSGVDILVHGEFPRAEDGEALALGLSYNRDVFGAAVQADVPVIVNVSSQSVYSPARERAAAEDTPVSLESPYATAKYATELLLDVCSSITTRRSNLRLASLIGPHFNQRVVNKLVKIAMTTGELSVLSGRSLFAFMDVRDAADAVIAAVRSKVWDHSEILNVGAPGAYTLEEMASVVATQVTALGGGHVTVSDSGSEPQRTSSQLDSTAFTDLTGFTPSFQLSDSVRDIILASRAS